MSCDPVIASADGIARPNPNERAVPSGTPGRFTARFAGWHKKRQERDDDHVEFDCGCTAASPDEVARNTTHEQMKTKRAYRHLTLLRWQPLGADLRAASHALNSYADHPDYWGRPNHLHA
jgi:hypothetical protein